MTHELKSKNDYSSWENTWHSGFEEFSIEILSLFHANYSIGSFDDFMIQLCVKPGTLAETRLSDQLEYSLRYLHSLHWKHQLFS